MTDIQQIRAQLLEKSRLLQKQYNINNQVDKLAEIQENILKEDQRKKRKITKKKSISTSESNENVRRSRRLLGEQADLSNIDFEFLETTSKVTNASNGRPLRDLRPMIKSGNLAGDEVADTPITIDNVEYTDVDIKMNATDKQIMDNMQMELVGDIHKITKHRITDMALHPSNLCALGDKEGSVVLWKYDNLLSTPNATEIPTTSSLNIHDSNISYVGFINNDSLLTTTYSNMRLTNLQTFESEELIKDYKISACYTVDHLIYYGGTDGKIHLRDLKSRRSSRVLAIADGKKLNTIDIRNNSILTCGLNRKVQIFDIRNTNQIVSEFEHGYSVNSAYFNKSGNQIVTTSYDNYLRLFNTSGVNSGPTMKRVHDCQTGKWVSKFKARFDSSDSVIYCADKSRKIMFYSLKNMKLLYNVGDFSAIPAIVCARTQWSWDSKDVIITGNATGKCQILKGIKKDQ